MIWLRWLLAFPLIILLICLLFFVVLVTQVNSTIGNPDFYNQQMVKADVYNFVYDDLLPAALDEVEAEESYDIPIDLEDIEDDIIAVAKKVAPPSWLRERFEGATAAVIPYMVGDSDGFTYTLPLKDLVENAADAAKEDILNGDAFDSIYDDMMVFMAGELHKAMSAELEGTGVEVTRGSVEDSLRDNVPQAWLVDELEGIIDAVEPYITGDTNSFTVAVDLNDLYSDAELLELLGAGNEAYLDDARDMLSDGLLFTEDNLTDSLGAKEVADIRDLIKNGRIFTEEDLLEQLSEESEGVENLDRARGWIHTGRTLLWLLWLLPVLLLVGIGFLGGRTWKERVGWAFAVLLFSSLIVYIAISLIYSHAVAPNVQDPIQMANLNAMELVLAQKGNEVINNSAADMFDGMKMQAIYMMIAGGVGLLAVGGWYLYDRTQRRPKQRTPSKPGKSAPSATGPESQ
jgi:hypothetical protein